MLSVIILNTFITMCVCVCAKCPYVQNWIKFLFFSFSSVLLYILIFLYPFTCVSVTEYHLLFSVRLDGNSNVRATISVRTGTTLECTNFLFSFHKKNLGQHLDSQIQHSF